MRKELTGKRFGRLTVIERAPHKDDRPAWLCACDCGNRVIVQTKRLLGKKNNRTVTCGCWRGDNKAFPSIAFGNVHGS